MKKARNPKTTLKEQGLAVAMYVHDNFHWLAKQAVDLQPKQILHHIVQGYLNTNKHRLLENKLTGIVAIQDVWRNATGGRVHLVVGASGPLIESMQRQIISYPIDYEAKSRLLLRAIASVCGYKAPWAGNIHFHLWHTKQPEVQLSEVLHFLRQEHGFQNELQQLADVKLFLLIPLASQPRWQETTRQALCRVLKPQF
ncbi:MAG TPA: hypothetical protein PKD79_01630 [Candidatus Doudnabacteria bacterium]|nr:hypothetical protein [Candidatus Doudnabacteria bacterium]